MSRPTRPAARILLVDRDDRILLFRFDPADRAPFWVTPGGAVDPGEDFDTAARRELREETGLDLACGPQVARREAVFVTLQGVEVEADERYYLVRTDRPSIDTGGHTAEEQQVMRSWRWFAADEIADWPETIYPLDLTNMLESVR